MRFIIDVCFARSKFTDVKICAFSAEACLWNCQQLRFCLHLEKSVGIVLFNTFVLWFSYFHRARKVVNWSRTSSITSSTVRVAFVRFSTTWIFSTVVAFTSLRKLRLASTTIFLDPNLKLMVTKGFLIQNQERSTWTRTRNSTLTGVRFFGKHQSKPVSVSRSCTKCC